MKHRILSFIVPLLAGFTILGAGYATFVFVNDQAKTALASGPTITIGGDAEVGTVSFKYDASSLFLIVTQRRVYFNVNYLDVVYTPGSNWDSGVQVPVTFQATMTLDPNLIKWFTAQTVSPWIYNNVADGSWQASGNVGEYVTNAKTVEVSTSTSLRLQIPALSFSHGIIEDSARFNAMAEEIREGAIGFHVTASLDESVGN